MCEGNCKCNCKEDRREGLVNTLDELYALREQTADDIRSVENELKLLDEMEHAKDNAYKIGCMIKANLDGLVDAGFTEDQALALIITQMGTTEVKVEL